MELHQQLTWDGVVVAETTTIIQTLPSDTQLYGLADQLWTSFMDSDQGPAHLPAMIFTANVVARKAKTPLYILLRLPFKLQIGHDEFWEDFTSQFPEDGLKLAIRQGQTLEAELEDA